jgi:hypothetical protein
MVIAVAHSMTRNERSSIQVVLNLNRPDHYVLVIPQPYMSYGSVYAISERTPASG